MRESEQQQMAEQSQCGKRRFARVLLVIVFLSLAGACLAGLAYYRSASAFLKNRMEAALNVRIETMRAEGLPVTLAELDKWYVTLPPDQNAATVLQQAFALYAKPVGRNGRRRGAGDEQESPLPIIGPARLPPASEPLPAEMKEAIAETLAQNEAALKLLHRGASMRACRYPTDLTKGFSVRLAHLENVRMGARLLTLEMLLRIENGQSDPAIESARDCFGLAHTLAHEPVVISQLVRFGCQWTAMPCLQRLLTRVTLSDEQLAQVNQMLIDAEEPEGLTRAFVGERCNLIEIYGPYRQSISAPMRYWPTLQQLRNMSWHDAYYYPQEVAKARRYSSSGLFALDALVAFELRTATIQASQLPLSEQPAAAKTIMREEDTYSRGGSSFMIMPAAGASIIKQAKTVAVLRAARGAIAAERYRLAHGKIPDKLDADSIIDPFNGQPLRYKKLTLGYAVYSVGEDRSDDDGDQRKDILFTVDR
jgi:hypothetical protein